MARQIAEHNPLGPFGLPRWLTPTVRLVLGAAVLVPLAANGLFWLMAWGVASAAGHDVDWAYWTIAGVLVAGAVESLIAYGRHRRIGIEWIAGSVLLLIPAVAAWGAGVFVALLLLAGDGS